MKASNRVDEANGPIPMRLQRVCHDTLPRLISVSLGVVPMCILTPRTLNICGLILSFIGGVMLFIRFLAHLIRASGRPIWQSWFVRWCGRLGIAVITIGFLLQLVAKFSQ
jgi:NADH:ubiquinone oxidoreductase subunit 6 (subunit J)